MDPAQLGFIHRRKARIFQRGGNGMFAHVFRQRLIGFERADTSAQFMVDGQRDEARAVFQQARRQRR